MGPILVGDASQNIWAYSGKWKRLQSIVILDVTLLFL